MARKLQSVAIVACGYGGDMPEDLADELLDDIDFEFNKVRCRKIEQMLPRLRRMWRMRWRCDAQGSRLTLPATK